MLYFVAKYELANSHSEFLGPPMGRRDGRADAVMLHFSDRA